jgi:hypothetical protein
VVATASRSIGAVLRVRREPPPVDGDVRRCHDALGDARAEERREPPPARGPREDEIDVVRLVLDDGLVDGGVDERRGARSPHEAVFADIRTGDVYPPEIERICATTALTDAVIAALADGSARGRLPSSARRSRSSRLGNSLLVHSGWDDRSRPDETGTADDTAATGTSRIRRRSPP